MPRSTKDILKEAFLRGRAWDPAYPNLQNLDSGRVDLMDGSEGDAKLLVKSLQESDSNAEVFSQHFNKRPLNADGEIGPATQALVDHPRCPIPDFAPPPGARFFYDDPELQKVVESQQRFEEAFVGGSGGWPMPGCDPQRQGVHSIRVGIQTSNAPPNWKTHKEKILQATIDCAAEQGLAVRYILDDPNADIEASVKFENIPGSVIGYCHFPTPNTCNQTIKCRLDIGYDPSNWQLHANLDVHEYIGHGIGLQHTRGGMMNPSILLVWPLSYNGDPSKNALTRLYGGQPIPSGPGPTPEGPEHPQLLGPIFAEQNSAGGISLRGATTLSIPPNFPGGTFKWNLVPDQVQGQYIYRKRIEV